VITGAGALYKINTRTISGDCARFLSDWWKMWDYLLPTCPQWGGCQCPYQWWQTVPCACCRHI